MPEVGPNPFQPGRGILPPLLAGRDAELGAADEALAQLTEGRSPSQDLLFYGPRGNGKTTILLEVARRARERGFRVDALSPPALDGVEHLVHDLQERTGRLQGQVTGFQVAGVGATGIPAAPTEDIPKLLTSWIDAEPARPLVIVLDEVQMLPPEVGRSLFDAVQGTAVPGSQPRHSTTSRPAAGEPHLTTGKRRAAPRPGLIAPAPGRGPRVRPTLRPVGWPRTAQGGRGRGRTRGNGNGKGPMTTVFSGRRTGKVPRIARRGLRVTVAEIRRSRFVAPADAEREREAVP